MPRIRTIKPDLAKHEGLFDAERESGLPVRYVWSVLPCFCDREGRFPWRDRRLTAEILPYDEDADMARVLDALLTRGFLVKYRVNDAWFGWVPTFLKHQVVNNRESASELPSPDSADEIICNDNQKLPDALVTRAARVDDAKVTPQMHAQGEGKGREGKGKEGSGSNEPVKFARREPDPGGEKPTWTSMAREVFIYWQAVMGHPRAKFNPDDARIKAVIKQLKAGYSVDELKRAVDGCSMTPHNMGENDRGQRYDGLNVVCKNGDNVDRFIRTAETPDRTAMGSAARKTATAAERWLKNG